MTCKQVMLALLHLEESTRIILTRDDPVANDLYMRLPYAI